MNLNVLRYSKTYEQAWNEFVTKARNATFLFQRDFMDYHSDRFLDHSLVVFDENNKMIACFPANESDGIIYSHQGLTYGGLIQFEHNSLSKTINLWENILSYYHSCGIKEVRYKHFPNFFNHPIIQDCEYVMFLIKAELYRRDTAFIIDNQSEIKIASNYIREAKKAQRKGIATRFSDDFEGFWNDILVPNLKERFGVKPVHSLKEMSLLREKFDSEIKLYAAYNVHGEMVSGTVLFDCGHVRHCQYISSNHYGRQSGALNFLFYNLIEESKEYFRYFDFGIANENNGEKLNIGLSSWKQRMGGRVMVHDFYRILTCNSSKLAANEYSI